MRVRRKGLAGHPQWVQRAEDGGMRQRVVGAGGGA